MTRIAPAASHLSPSPANASVVADRAPRESIRLAAIDLGSNSIHMVVAQVDADGGITTLWRMKEMVGLGRLSFPSRRLSRESMDTAVATLGRFKQAAQHRQCEKIIAVATSAIREAHNGGDFIERCKRELKLNVRVISARDEARLIYLAVRHAVPLGDQPHFLIDIGGGSVEFIVADQKKAALLESRKLGAARMTAQHVHSDPINRKDLATLQAAYARELGPLCKQVLALGPVAAIGTSGTIENLVAMCGGDEGEKDSHNAKASVESAGSAPASSASPASTSDSSHPKHAAPSAITGVIHRRALKRLVEALSTSTSAQRAEISGLDDQRKDQIVAGAMLVLEVLTRLDIKRLSLCRSALREGILLDYLSRHVPDMEIRRELPDPRRRTVIDLARRCDWHQVHSEQVATVCLKLFDELRPLHGMGPAERELIEYAALLHDIGWHIGRKGHHKHSLYLILHGDLRNFAPEEVQIIANIARYHRESPPSKKHKAYANLGKRARRIVDVGAALLRLADGLDRSHASVVQGLKCRIDGKNVRCALAVRADAELEIWGARRKLDWYESAFGGTIDFVVAGKRKTSAGK